MKLSWFLLGVVVTIAIEVVGAPLLHQWQNRYGVPSAQIKFVTLHGTVEKFGDALHVAFSVTGDPHLSPVTVANSDQPEISAALFATVGSTVTASGIIYPAVGQTFYLTTLNGKRVTSIKAALAMAGPPTVGALLASVKNRDQVTSCLKQALADRYDATLLKHYTEMEFAQVKVVSDCFVDLSASPVPVAPNQPASKTP